MKCPRCNFLLCSIVYDGVQIEICPECKGEWLHAGELQKIVQHHDEDDHDELNCPHCEGVRMEHFNYGDTSGIILHKCPECGGIWTDKDQLMKVEEVVDGWKTDDEDVAKYGPILQKIEVEEQKQLDQAVSISKFGFVNSVLRRFCE